LPLLAPPRMPCACRERSVFACAGAAHQAAVEPLALQPKRRAARRAPEDGAPPRARRSACRTQGTERQQQPHGPPARTSTGNRLLPSARGAEDQAPPKARWGGARPRPCRHERCLAHRCPPRSRTSRHSRGRGRADPEGRRRPPRRRPARRRARRRPAAARSAPPPAAATRHLATGAPLAPPVAWGGKRRGQRPSSDFGEGAWTVGSSAA
jgi:hypothetical protein